MTKNIIWLTESLMNALAITKDFEPLRVWRDGAYTDEQATEQVNGQNMPVWRSEAILQAGYSPSLTSVEVRALSKTKPVVTISKEKQLDFLTVQELTAPAPKLPVGGGRHG